MSLLSSGFFKTILFIKRRQRAEGRGQMFSGQEGDLDQREKEEVSIQTFCPLPSFFCLQERSDVKIPRESCWVGNWRALVALDYSCNWQ